MRVAALSIDFHFNRGTGRLGHFTSLLLLKRYVHIVEDFPLEALAHRVLCIALVSTNNFLRAWCLLCQPDAISCILVVIGAQVHVFAAYIRSLLLLLLLMRVKALSIGSRLFNMHIAR